VAIVLLAQKNIRNTITAKINRIERLEKESSSVSSLSHRDNATLAHNILKDSLHENERTFVVPSNIRNALPYRLKNPPVLNVTSFIDVGTNGSKIGKTIKRVALNKFYTTYENISISKMLRDW